MSQDLVCQEITTLKVDAEPSSRNNSSRIERVLNDGFPLFPDEIGCFPSSAEKYYISTSNREKENTNIGLRSHINSTKWDLINKQHINVLKNLESLTNIIFCIQKGYCDNIQYINISQSHSIASSVDSISTRSLRINEASKDELLISIFRRLCMLKPFVEKINNEVLRIPGRFVTHKSALNTINELMPIWKISLNSQTKNEAQHFFSRENILSITIYLQLPLKNTFFKQKESFVSNTIKQIDDNLFSDAPVSLFFNNSELNGYTIKHNLRASIKLPEFTSYLINENYQLYVKIMTDRSASKSNTSHTAPKVVFPSCIKSVLAKQIHSILHKVHWVLIDRLIFHTIVQQVVNFQKDFPENIYIKELSSEHIIFSLFETSPCVGVTNVNLGLEFKDISVFYKPLSTKENCFLSSYELNALKLLRESFIEIWEHSSKLNLDKLLESQMCGVSLCKYSNKLLERWIYKLAKKCIKY